MRNKKVLTAPQVQILSSGKTPQPESFLPMVHGTATDSLAYLIGSAIEENPLNNTAMLKRGTVELVINSVDEKGKQIRSIGVSTHQLLSIAMVNFTSINHTGSNKDKRIDSKLVHIPLKKFAHLCGYDVIEHTKNTEEEQLKESKREQTEAVNKIMEKQAEEHSAEIAKLQEQLNAANNQIKEFQSMNIDEIKASAAAWQEKYAASEKAWNEKLAALKYEAAAKDAVADIKFSSNSARRAFLNDLKAKKTYRLKMTK